MMGIYRTGGGAREVEARYRELLARWPVPSEQLRLPTREGETFVVVSGPADAPPLLLLQGSGANAAMWLGDVAAWSGHFRVYAVDLIGEPGLSAPSRPTLGSDAYVGWIDDLMAALSLKQASMVGVSLGGWLALDYATRRPDRVTSLVLLCPSGVGRRRAGFMFKAVPLLFLGRWGRRRLMRMLAAGTSLRGLSIAPGFPEMVTAIQKHFLPRRVRIPRFSDEALARLSMPVMLVVGGRDVMVDSRDTKDRLERLAPQVTVRFLPEAGHLLPSQTEPVLAFRRAPGV